MPLRPPTPETPTTDNDRLLISTTTLATALEHRFDLDLEPATLEAVLFELDRAGYLEWVTLTTDGDHVWDLTDTAEKTADVIAAVTAAVAGALLERV